VLRKPDDVALGLLHRAIKPETTNLSSNYRGAVLIQMIQLHRTGMMELPGMNDGKPSEALFKAIAKVPMKKNQFPPFDADDLIQLIEKEEGRTPHE